jgi:hypothetical protein
MGCDGVLFPSKTANFVRTDNNIVNSWSSTFLASVTVQLVLFLPTNDDDASGYFITIGDNPDVSLNKKCTAITIAGLNSCDSALKGRYFGIYSIVALNFKEVMVYS